MPEPSRVSQSTPVTVNGAPVVCASISLPRAWVGLRSCRPVRSCGSAPIGLKYRRAMTRWHSAPSPRVQSWSTCSIICLVRAYGLLASTGQLSSTRASGVGA